VTTKRLSSNVTIEDVADRLADPAEYVRAVLQRMDDCLKRHGSAQVRIGVKGTGDRPNYRVEAVKADEGHLTGNSPSVLKAEMSGDEIKAFEQEMMRWTAAFFTAYSGISHRKLSVRAGALRREHWSTRYMSIEQVRALLGRIRGYSA
jgi:hypothetical protein